MKHQVTRINKWNISALTSLIIFIFFTLACSQESKTNKLSDKTETQREVFTVVEEQPSYEGGMDTFYKYVISEMKYPLRARNAGTEGTVEVQFIIERNGTISDAKAINSIGSGCDEEAVRVIKNALGFKAGSQRGRTVRTAMTIPITFKLNKEKKNPDNSTQGTIITGEITSNNGELNVTADYNNGAWSGTILSPTGDNLPGASIVVAGTVYGTVTGLDGKFSVEATEDQELHISYVGYKKVIIKK